MRPFDLQQLSPIKGLFRIITPFIPSFCLFFSKVFPLESRYDIRSNMGNITKTHSERHSRGKYPHFQSWEYNL